MGWGRRESSAPGQCRHCLRRRDVFSVGRSGGGTYRRGGRHYRSSICGECATDLLGGAGGHPGGSVASFDTSGLEDVVGSLGTEEAAEVLTAYRERKDRVRWRREADRARWQAAR